MYSRFTTHDPKASLFWWQFSYISVIFTPIFFSQFVFRLLKLNRRRFLIALYSIGIIFLFLDWYDNSKYFLTDVRFVFNEFYWHDWTKSKSIIQLIFYIGFYWFFLLYLFFLLVRHYRKSKGLFRLQLKYFILGSIIGFLGPHGDYLIVFGFNIYPLSNFFISIYPLIFAIAIIKYRLMDINIAITRAGIFIAIYTIVLGIPFAVAGWLKSWLIQAFGPGWWMLPLILMA